MRARLLIRRIWTICALQAGADCPAEEYIRSLNESDKKKVLALLKRTAFHGPPHNREKFLKVEDDLFEFKVFQHRILCFFRPGRVIVLTHGFRKKRDRIPSGEIQRAVRLRDDYLSAS